MTDTDTSRIDMCADQHGWALEMGGGVDHLYRKYKRGTVVVHVYFNTAGRIADADASDVSVRTMFRRWERIHPPQLLDKVMGVLAS